MAEEVEPAVPQVLKPPPVQVNDPPKFDLDTYISNYDGPSRLDRLITIGLSSIPIRYDALKTAQSEARTSRNIPRYLAISNYLTSTYPKDSTIIPDLTYITETQSLTQSETVRLEQELKGYKNNLIKESIRMATEELGIHHFFAGNLPEAAKSFAKMREFCTTQAHLAFMHLRMALVGIAQGNWLNVQNCVSRIQAQSAFNDYGKLAPAIRPLFGLCALSTNDYGAAASHFVSTDPAFAAPLEPVAGGVVINRAVLSANDCAIYGALTALATFDRAAIQTQLLDTSAPFRQFLELEPHLRRALVSFVGSKYTQCLRVLQQYRTDWLCDVYLQRHVDGLFTLIRRKCIVEYFKPFSVVTIGAMAQAFGAGTGDEEIKRMTDELLTMIETGLLDARVDAVRMLLVKPSQASQRRQALTRALQAAEEYEMALKCRLLRAEMLLQGLDGSGEKKGAGGGGAAGRGEYGDYEEDAEDAADAPVLAKRGKKSG